MSNRSGAAINYSTRTIKIYASAFDAQARADIEAHLADIDNPHQVSAADVGLDQVNNTSDADKPISAAQAAALALKAPLASPPLSGVPTAPTAAVGTVTTQLATAEFVQAAINAAGVTDIGDDLAAHLVDWGNPHQVDAADVGLGAVNNTADADKPVSSATQAAINVVAGDVADVEAALAAHTGNTSNPHAVDAADVGLGSVDNTADLDKPVSTATQAAINAAVTASGDVAADLADHLADTANPHAVDKSDVGLGSVDNTADAAKPVSAAQQTALNLKANIASPALTGVPTAPTAAPHTNTTQLATTAYADAGDLALDAAVDAAGAAAAAAQADADAAQAAAAAAQTDATQALADAATAQTAADAAQAAADAAQADADTALVDAAEAQDTADAAGIIGQVPSRPGDAVALYGQTKTGQPDAAVPVDPAWVIISTAGSVVRVNSTTAADPQTIAPIAAYPVEPGRIYEVRWRVQRQTDPADPLNDSATVGLQWLTNAKAANGSTIVENIPLVIAQGVQQRSVQIGALPATTQPPAGTIYCRPFVDLYGDAHITDVVTIDWLDVTASLEPLPVVTVTPASGDTVTLTDPRPRYIANAAVLAALTIRLPPAPRLGELVEISYAHPVTALSIQDAAGVAVLGTPTSAYGPGSGHQYKYLGTSWVHWK